ncbi:SDR family NAD(P)-dependent oxidoreductase [Haloferula rosea]|uniref:SDR family NAD(P)-dependent oxidoreductase n=1 Tax=Haloferula rosea TaxID=490093 RepID=A0A934VFC7_9BACT|nr:SDR family NAD(P)-dependent oxidoreductase [Haloferula rosea]MBK1828229.1 SDR family NAD(P)-dependent oxidoreductase [Haloferula rosea]
MNERVLITGGEGDLAAAIADTFRRAGFDVRNPGRRELDVSSPESVSDYFSSAAPIDLLIANAGCAENGLLARTTESAWDRQFEINLHGAFRCARAALRPMVKRRHGHLIFLSSYSALHPPAGQVAYASAKAGLLGLSQSLAQEVGPANIRSNVILPGFLETKMTRDLPQARREQVLQDHRLERFNTLEATAEFILHLHRSMPHTSGQCFQLDSR